MAVNIIDRYLERQQVNKDYGQLIGLTALFIAGKYEEIYPPDIRDYASMCKGRWSKDHIIYVEDLIIVELDFELVFNSSLYFFEIFAKHFN